MLLQFDEVVLSLRGELTPHAGPDVGLERVLDGHHLVLLHTADVEPLVLALQHELIARLHVGPLAGRAPFVTVLINKRFALIRLQL